MDASSFASQLTEALDLLACGIPADPCDLDGITGATVTSYADAGIMTTDAGLVITTPGGSQLQVTIIQSTCPR